MSLLIEGGKNFAPDTQRRLFADHLDRWIGRFFADLRGARAAPFYAAVGALGERFMALERRYLVPMQ
jgi:TorA maturation chaperone TorD